MEFAIWSPATAKTSWNVDGYTQILLPHEDSRVLPAFGVPFMSSRFNVDSEKQKYHRTQYTYQKSQKTIPWSIMYPVFILLDSIYLACNYCGWIFEFHPGPVPKELRWDDVLHLEKGHQKKRFTWSFHGCGWSRKCGWTTKSTNKSTLYTKSSNDVFGDMFYILVSKKVDF